MEEVVVKKSVDTNKNLDPFVERTLVNFMLKKKKKKTMNHERLPIVRGTKGKP